MDMGQLAQIANYSSTAEFMRTRASGRPYYYSHRTDFFRFLVLYVYGGLAALLRVRLRVLLRTAARITARTTARTAAKTAANTTAWTTAWTTDRTTARTTAMTA